MKIFFNLLFLLWASISQAYQPQTGFDKQAFYNAMSSGSLEEVNSMLASVKASTLDEKEAYEGALLMKKAGLVSKAKEKLSLFKSGRTKLEAAIKKDNNNTEFVFLRLIIQEHAPKAVKYHSNIDSDSELIRNNYKNLPPVVQKAIHAYSKNSKVLKSQ